jgi:hypothetical protein
MLAVAKPHVSGAHRQKPFGTISGRYEAHGPP